MSDLYKRPISLLPPPQKISLSSKIWVPRASWKIFQMPDGKACALARNEREAQQLMSKAPPPPKERGPESYALSTLKNGAVATASTRAGLAHGRRTLQQLLDLAGRHAIPQATIEDWPDLPVRGIHLDLKYMMHRKDYLHSWLEDLASLKLNTLLLEYEDKFPYQQHSFLRHPLAFTPKELKGFLTHARALGLRVIPLIQNMGHVEYILKHHKFAYLRWKGFHTEYNTLHPEVWPLVKSILDEVLEYHQDDEWFHVGGDECFGLSKGEIKSAVQIYTNHMGRVLEHVIQRGKRPLIWDDMLRLLPGPLRRQSLKHLHRQTIFCYWAYDSTPHSPIPIARHGKSGRLQSTDRGMGTAWLEAWKDYSRAGFDVLGIPCHNWGPGVPFLERYTVPNTLTMIRDSVYQGALGVINSSWACFHVPMPLQDYGIALTADRAWKIDRRSETRDFDDAWSRLRMGLPDRTLVNALRQMGDMLEMPTRLGRGIHLPHYYYMDTVLYYRDGHKGRVKYGIGVHDVGKIDFQTLVTKKLRLLRQSPLRSSSILGLQRFGQNSQASLRLLRGLSGKTPRARKFLELARWHASFRDHAARRMLFLAGDTPATHPRSLLAESRSLRKSMRRIFGNFLESAEQQWEESSLFDGEEALLILAETGNF